MVQTKNLNAVIFTDLNIGFAVGDSGTILKTTDGGGSWLIQTSGTSNALRGVSFIDLNIGTAVGDSASNPQNNRWRDKLDTTK